MRKSDASLLKDKGIRVINIKIRENIYKELRQEALRNGIPVNDLICRYLIERLYDDTILGIRDRKDVLQKIN